LSVSSAPVEVLFGDASVPAPGPGWVDPEPEPEAPVAPGELPEPAACANSTSSVATVPLSAGATAAIQYAISIVGTIKAPEAQRCVRKRDELEP
jgi:hypothetical protein